MPTDTKIPAKQNWHSYSIWEFNGKRYRPLTDLAEKNLDSVVKQLHAAGFMSATKDGKRKPTSVKYAVLTTGVEDFRLLKA